MKINIFLQTKQRISQWYPVEFEKFFEWYPVLVYSVSWYADGDGDGDDGVSLLILYYICKDIIGLDLVGHDRKSVVDSVPWSSMAVHYSQPGFMPPHVHIIDGPPENIKYVELLLLLFKIISFIRLM